MVQLKKREFDQIINKLKEKFEVKTSRTGHRQIRIYYEGKYIERTKRSWGRGDVPPIIVGQIRKQLNFANSEELIQFKDCPLTCEQYLKLLEKRKVI